MNTAELMYDEFFTNLVRVANVFAREKTEAFYFKYEDCIESHANVGLLRCLISKPETEPKEWSAMYELLNKRNVVVFRGLRFSYVQVNGTRGISIDWSAVSHADVDRQRGLLFRDWKVIADHVAHAKATDFYLTNVGVLEEEASKGLLHCAIPTPPITEEAALVRWNAMECLLKHRVEVELHGLRFYLKQPSSIVVQWGNFNEEVSE